MTRKRTDTTKIVLKSVAVAGILAGGILAPNALGAMADLSLIPGKRQREIIDTARKRLIRRGLLEYKNGFVRVTEKGAAALQRLELRNYKIKKPKRWDKKWRVLIFDIPEKRKRTREQIRTTLVRIGFLHLQDSVWVYPYECEDLVELLKADFRIGKAVLYMVVEKLEADEYYKHQFGLLH